jgi:hypothetical protein
MNGSIAKLKLVVGSILATDLKMNKAKEVNMFDLIAFNSNHPELVEDVKEILELNGNNKVLIAVYRANLYEGNEYGFKEIGMRSYDFLKAFANAYYDEADVMYETDLNIFDYNEVYRSNNYDISKVVAHIRKNNFDYPAANVRLYELQFSGLKVVGHAMITDIIIHQ